MFKISFRDVIAAEGIKFWISPDNRFFSWPCKNADLGPHHEQKIYDVSHGEINDFDEAHGKGWVSGGNMQGNFYIRPYSLESCIEKIRAVPKQYLDIATLTIETEVDGQMTLDTYGQNPILVLMRYIRDKK